MTPAGFWRRYAAWSLDAAAISLLLWVGMASYLHARIAALTAAWQALDAQTRLLMQGGVDIADPLQQATRWAGEPAMLAAAGAVQSALNAVLWPPVIAFALLGLAYHVVCEASARQATFGQRALSLRVVGADGRPIAIVRAAQRHVAGALSWITANVGHAMALIPPRRLALHDIVSGTRVVQVGGDATLPLWAKAWIAAQGAALVWITIATTLMLSRAMQSTIESAL